MKILNALELTVEDINIAFEEDSLRVEDCWLVENTNPSEYAAMYTVVFEDDDSFLDDKSRYLKVFVSYTKNGKIEVAI